MSTPFLLGFVMPTDGPMPHPSIAPDVADMEAKCDYSMADEVTMSRFQWLAKTFRATITGNVRFRANGTTYPVMIDRDIPFEFGTGEEEILIHAPYLTVAGRMPTGPFEPGWWMSFTSLTVKGFGTIPGGLDVLDESGETISNYRIFWDVEIGAFTADPSRGINGTAHLIQNGDSYKIPFRARVQFVADRSGFTEGEPNPPLLTEATSPHYGQLLTPGGATRSAGGVTVGNGVVELFPMVAGFGTELFGLTNEDTFENTYYFSEVNVTIEANSLATPPPPP